MANIQERQNADGTVSYRVLVRLKGFPTQTATFVRKTDAKRWAQQTEVAIRENRYFQSSEAKKHTLTELIERYKKDYLPRMKSGNDRKHHLDWWKDELGCYMLVDMRPALIVEAKDKLASGITRRETVRSSATVNRYLAALSHAFTIAIKEYGWMEDNPVLKITKPKEPRGRVRFLSDDERKALLEACKIHSVTLYTIVVIALSTGARKNEIMSLRWQDIDQQSGSITLHETKNGERRTIPLQGHALHLVKELGKIRKLQSDLIFPAKRNPKQPLEIQNIWNEAVDTAQITDFRFHDLRHSAASYLAMNGASIAEIADVLGHKTLQMVKRYAHLSEAHTAGIVQRMNEKIFG